MIERSGDDPVGLDSPVRLRLPSTDRVLLVVGDDRIDSRSVGLPDLGGDLRPAERPQHAHGLRRAKGQVVARSELLLLPRLCESHQLGPADAPRNWARRCRQDSGTDARAFADEVLLWWSDICAWLGGDLAGVPLPVLQKASDIAARDTEERCRLQDVKIVVGCER